MHSLSTILKFSLLLASLCMWGCIDEAPGTNRNNTANNGTTTNNGTNNGANNGQVDMSVRLDAGHDMAPDMGPEEVLCTLTTPEPWIREPIGFRFSAPVDVNEFSVRLVDPDGNIQFDVLSLSASEIQIEVMEDVSVLPAEMTLMLPLETGGEIECSFSFAEYVSETMVIPAGFIPVGGPQFDGAKPAILLREELAGAERLRVMTRVSLDAAWQNDFQFSLPEDAVIVDFPRFDAIGLISPSANGLYEKRGNGASKISGDSPALSDPVLRRFLASSDKDLFVTQDKQIPLPTSQRCVRSSVNWECDVLPLSSLSDMVLAGDRVYFRAGTNLAVWNLVSGFVSSIGNVSIATTSMAGKAGERGVMTASFSQNEIEFESYLTTPPPSFASSDAATGMAYNDAGRLYVHHGEGVSVFDGNSWRGLSVRGKPIRNGIGLVVLVEQTVDNNEIHFHHPNRLLP